MTTGRVFSIGEVDALIPTLDALVERQLARYADIEQSLASLARQTGGLPSTLDDASDDSADVRALKASLRERIVSYESGWREVEALGAVVKDPQVGLLDFYGRIEGKLVWLCWRHGEQSLRYYHDLEAGFDGRRPLRPETRVRLVN